MELKEHIEDIDLSNYWAVLKRRWFPASAVFSLCLILAALATALMEPIYRANAKLLIETDRSSELTGLESQAEAGELDTLSARSEPLTTQAEIIKSPAVAQATIEALDIRSGSGEQVQPWVITRDLGVRPVPGADVLEVSFESPDPVLAAAVVNQVIAEYQEKNIAMNQKEAQAARDFILEELPSTEKSVQEAEAALRQFKEDNNVLVLQEEASAAVSTLNSLDRNITDIQADLQDISAQSAGLRNRVGMSAEQAVAMSALSQAPGVQEALVQLQEVQGALSTERARYREGHPAIAELQRQEEFLSDLLDERIIQVLGNSQAVSLGNLQLGDLQQGLIADFVRSEIQRIGLSQRLGELQAARAQLQGRSQKLPELEQTQRELERRLSAAQITYETLLTRLQEVQVAENQAVGNAQLISEATVPGRPIAPSKKLNMGAGIVVGGLLSIATAFLIDLGDRTLKTVKETRRIFGYPLLGIIPAFDSAPEGTSSQTSASSHDAYESTSRQRVVVKNAPQSPISSAFQMLQANLNVLGTEHPPQTLVISSAIPGEGKSEVAANLAAAAAQAGQRVLLIDADLRHPSQHRYWHLANEVGLSNALVAQLSLRQAMQQRLPNLHVLTAGVIPPNTIALLSSHRMTTLLETARQKYDLILLDTPALAGAADAATLGKIADGVLLVVRPGLIDRAQATHARDFLTQAGLTVLGMVANGVVVKDEPESYFYFQDAKANTSQKAANNVAILPNSA